MSGPTVNSRPTTYIQTNSGYSSMKSLSYNKDYQAQPKLRKSRQPLDTAFLTQLARQQYWEKRQQMTMSMNVAVNEDATAGEDGNGSSRLFSFTTADDQDQVDLTALAYIVSIDDNCDCITFPLDVPDEDINVFECTDDAFWDRIRLVFSDSSCFELEFPEGVMYTPYCTGETTDLCALCTIKLSMGLDEGSSSLMSSNSEEDSTANSLDETGGTTTDTEDGSLELSSSSSKATSEQSSSSSQFSSSPSSSSNQFSSSSAARETTTEPASSPASNPAGFSIGRLLTLDAMIVLAIQ